LKETGTDTGTDGARRAPGRTGPIEHMVTFARMRTDRLMECAKAGALGGDASALHDLRDVDVDALAAAARALNCLSIVATTLRSLPGCAPALAQELDRVEARAWADHMITEAAIGPLLQQAADRRITVVVYKGAAQAARYYRNPWTRWMADVDLLVPQAEKESLCEIMSAHGHRLRFTPGRVITERMSHERSYAPPTPGARAVDIHTAPTSPARYHLAVSEMIERATPGTLFGAPVRFLTPEDELLIMAVNQAYDHFRLGFIRYLDAWLITRQIAVEWPTLAAAARAAGAMTATWLTLSNAARVAGVSVPTEILDELEPPPGRRAWLRALLTADGLGDPRFALPRRFEQALLVYPMLDRPRDFGRFLAVHGALRALDWGRDIVDELRARAR
jgi:Uncharacterised nucleotidyltransferase